MKKTTFITFLALIIFSLSTATLAAPVFAVSDGDRLDRLEQELLRLKKENERLKDRLGQIETLTNQHEAAEASQDHHNSTKQNELLERIEIVESEAEESRYNLLAGLVNISGYADIEYGITDSKSESNGFRLHHLSLFFKKDIQEKWKLFSEIEFEDAPLVDTDRSSNTVKEAHGKILAEQLYVEYQPMLDLDLRFGRFITPAGYWNIFHYNPYVPTQVKPMMIKTVFPKSSDGIQLRKSFSIAGSLLNTHLYVVNGRGNNGFGDKNQNRAVGARINYSPDILDRIDIGVSFYGEKDNDKVRRNSYSVHLRGEYDNLALLTEYATRDNNPGAGLTDYSDTSWFAEAQYDIGKWTLAGRYDWYDKNDSKTDAVHKRYTGALNYHFAHNVIGKVEYHKNKFDDPTDEDYYQFISSIVIAIGDL